MKNHKRAERRRHKDRMKRKAKRKFWWYDDVTQAVKYADHLAVCSCMACGNPRKFFNQKTMQERKAELEATDNA